MGRPKSEKQNNIRKNIILDEEYQYLLEDSGKLWCIPNNKQKTKFRVWYRVEKKYLHRWLMNAKPGELVDHINGNSLDNRLCNLRIVTDSQNTWNSKAHNDSKGSTYKGVSFWSFKHYTRKKPWVTQIMKNGNRKKKYFATEIEAAEQYNIWALELYGDFAVINIIKKDNE